MTREELEKDLAALKTQRDQLIANVNATAGVIQYIESKLALPDNAPTTDQA